MTIEKPYTQLSLPSESQVVSNAEFQCTKCPRLVEYRRSIKPKPQYAGFPYHNAPALPFGDPDPWFLVVGLAPGAHGCNRTGVPFQGDGAGTLLYQALFECGLSNRGDIRDYAPDLELNGVLITNTVWCVPPQNRPTKEEFHACRPNLLDLLQAKKRITDILCIGADAWREVHAAFNCKMPKFAHGAKHIMAPYTIYTSFHTSTYNQNTGRINLPMLTELIKVIKQRLLQSSGLHRANGLCP